MPKGLCGLTLSVLKRTKKALLFLEVRLATKDVISLRS